MAGVVSASIRACVESGATTRDTGVDADVSSATATDCGVSLLGVDCSADCGAVTCGAAGGVFPAGVSFTSDAVRTATLPKTRPHTPPESKPRILSINPLPTAVSTHETLTPACTSAHVWADYTVTLWSCGSPKFQDCATDAALDR